MMHFPKFITLTGIDDGTQVIYARAISEYYPVEWGVLLSATRQGTGRYPSLGFVRNLIMQDGFAQRMRLSAHLCGDWSRRAINGEVIEELADILPAFQRIQINAATKLNKYEIDALEIWMGKQANRRADLIIQTRNPMAFPTHATARFLYDASGGRGILPSHWPAPSGSSPGHYVGYAGGLSVYNVNQVLEQLPVTAETDYWLDVETGLRIRDKFSLDLCRAFCEAVYGRRH